MFGLLIGPVGLDLLSWETNNETIKILAELTLALVLFIDAASADMGVLKKTAGLPTRLLLIGLPLTILLGFGLGVVLIEPFSLFEIAILATVLALLTWVVFGTLIGSLFADFSWLILLYSILSLTVIRMLPVFISLTGLSMSTEGKLFVGWFGPRGLASIVFAVMVLDANLPNSRPIALAVVCTVILSILFHGLSANPWVKGFGARSNNEKS